MWRLGTCARSAHVAIPKNSELVGDVIDALPNSSTVLPSLSLLRLAHSVDVDMHRLDGVPGDL